MNLANALFGSLFISLFVLHASSPWAASNSNADPHPGRVTFIYDDGVSQCGVDATQRMFEVSYYAGGPGIRPCDVNRIRYIKFDSVRSAVTVRLWSYMRSGEPGGCQPGEKHNFTLYLRTLKNPTHTQRIQLQNLQDIKENEPVQPGVLLTKKIITNPDTIDRRLSCVEIIYD